MGSRIQVVEWLPFGRRRDISFLEMGVDQFIGLVGGCITSYIIASNFLEK